MKMQDLFTTRKNNNILEHLQKVSIDEDIYILSDIYAKQNILRKELT